MRKRKSPQQNLCCICKQLKSPHELFPTQLLRHSLAPEIQNTCGEWGEGDFVCTQDLIKLRMAHLENKLTHEKGKMSRLEEEVLQSIKASQLVSENLNLEYDKTLTLGQRVADNIATFGGSWPFIFLFGGVVTGWIVLNTAMLTQRAFDPYPFILLNLVLSTVAAIQAPIIMMSQNRQEARDRMHSEHDYRVNLKAELEIRQLNAKLDILMNTLWQQMTELQETQLEILETVNAQKPLSQ